MDEIIGSNIKMDLNETVCGHAEWIKLLQYRVQWRACVSRVIHFKVP
jgi:hypothetical protein